MKAELTTLHYVQLELTMSELVTLKAALRYYGNAEADAPAAESVNDEVQEILHQLDYGEGKHDV